MKDLLIFSCIVVFGLIPFGTILVWSLYRNTIVFPAAMLVFISSMICAIVAFAVSEFGFKSLFWAIPSCVIFLLSTNFFIKKIIRKPLRDLRSVMDEAATGNLNVVIKPKTLEPIHEIGSIARSFQVLIKSLHKIDDFADEIAKNNFTVDYQLLSEKDQIGKSLLNMRTSLLKAQEQEKIRMIKEDEENWVNQGIAKFSDILRNNSDNQEQLAVNFIHEMVEYLGIVQGGIFIINEDAEDEIFYELAATVAYDRQKILDAKFRLGESLVGRCAYEQLPIYMTEVPVDYVKITSGLGEANPRSISLIPAVMENKVYAVIELVSFDVFKPFQLNFISRIGENLASTISMVRVHEQTTKLLEESNKQQEELASQEEEMRQNMEELIATQEEMKRKEDELVAMTIELQRRIDEQTLLQ